MKDFMKVIFSKTKNEDMIIEILGVFSVLKLGSAWKEYLS